MRQCRCTTEDPCRRCMSKAAGRRDAQAEIAGEMEDMIWPEDDCGPYCPCVIADDNNEFAEELEQWLDSDDPPPTSVRAKP